MTPRRRRWLLWALLASLALHILTLGGDTLLQLADAWSHGEPLRLTKVSKPLTDQELDVPASPAHLPGVKPVEQQTITLGGLAPTGKSPKTKVAQRKPHRPALRKAKPPIQAQASTAVSAETNMASGVAIADAGVASAASAVGTAASAPVATQVASAPAASVASAPVNMAREKHFPHKVEIMYLWTVIPATMTWQVEQDHYRLQLQGALFGRTRTITSEGRIGKTGVVPLHFTDHKDGKLLNEATFDWDAMTVQMNDGGKVSQAALQPGDQDLFSAAFQFALQGSKMKNFTFSMVSGRKFYHNVAFELRGQARLFLGDTAVDAVLLHGEYEDRAFDFWLAPQWNNMPVRIHLTLGKENTFDIWARKVVLDDKTVLQTYNPQTTNRMHRP